MTDKKFQLEDKKRRLAQHMFELTSTKRLDQAKADYQKTKSDVARLVKESGNDRERHILTETIAREQAFINSSHPEKIRAVTADLDRVRWQILWRSPDFLIGMFKHLGEKRSSMNDELQAKQLFENGKRSIEAEKWDDLRQINGRLWDLMPDVQQASEELRIYTGIV